MTDKSEVTVDLEAAKSQSTSLSNPDAQRMPFPNSKLKKWEVEEEGFWNAEGAAIASRNLWTSVPQLLMGFGVWLVWSVITARIQLVHDENPECYQFKSWGSPQGDAYKSMLYLLPGSAGLAGGTLRIPNSFMVAVAGGRNVVALTTLMLIPSMLLGTIWLSDKDVDFSLLIFAAMLSGVGGGAFASSMSNISFFYPKAKQGYALGVNGGLGNLGVSIAQLLCPLMMTGAFFGGEEVNTDKVVDADTGEEKNPTPMWVQNGPAFWLPFLIIGMVLAWFWMSNMPQHGSDSTLANIGKYFSLEVPAIVASGCGVGVLIATRKTAAFTDTAGGAIVRIFLLVIIACTLEHLFMAFLSPKEVRDRLRIQSVIFKDKHTYIMTVLYTMCFGSFIGFSGSFPKLIVDVFGYLPELDESGSRITNPNAPPVFNYAWMGALVGSLIRPVGGVAADKWGGAFCTQICIVGSIIFSIAVAEICKEAKTLDKPEDMFGGFVFCFIMLFACTGAMNGTTFRSIAVIFPPEQAGPVLGWSSAIASYGAFIIPNFFGLSVKAGAVETTLYGLCAYYVLCFGVNLWYYARPGAEKPC